MVAVVVRTRACAVTRRCVSSMVQNSRDSRCAKYVGETRVDDESTTGTPEYLSPSQREMLTSAIRVDQAGEVAANWIYRGQMAILGKDVMAGPVIQASNIFRISTLAGWTNNSAQEMWDQEKKHLEVMNRLQVQHNVRPSLLTPVAQIAGFGLGAVTALMGKEAAMACTEAVETTIGEHYDELVLFPSFSVDRF